jgi:hypothetical protein
MRINQGTTRKRERSGNSNKQQVLVQAQRVDLLAQAEGRQQEDTVAQLALAFEVAIKKTLQCNFNPIPTAAEISGALALLPRRILPPVKRGRPQNPIITRAVELRRAGKRWGYIYREAIENFDSLPKDSQTVRMSQLRQAVHAREKSKKEPLDFFHEETGMKFSD